MSNPWLTHLKKFHSQHPSLSYKEAMKEAKKTYTPISGSKKKSKIHGGKSIIRLPTVSYIHGNRKRKHGGNPAALAVAGQALGVGNNLISSISNGVTTRLQQNGFYNRERLRNDRKEYNKLIMDLYVEAHRRGENNYTREDAIVDANRMAKEAGLII